MADQSISNAVLRMVLSQANKEQNQHYPPSVFEAHYSLVTHWLIDESAKLYPGTQSIVDLIKPYFKTMLVRVVNGAILFPDTYRHLLGFGIYVKDDKIPKECEGLGEDVTEKQIKELIAKTQSTSFDATQVSIGRWNKLTKHRYKMPQLDDAIACIFNNEGIKICPYDVPFVEVRYIIKTTPFKFGYKMNDDDTYYFDATTTNEALWTENAISYLFKGVNLLYSNFVRDPEHTASAKDLKDSGLF